MQRPAAAAAIAAVLLLAVGCTSEEEPGFIEPDILEPQIEDYVEESLAVRSGVIDVDCPDDVEIVVGDDFICTATHTKDGSTLDVEVDITGEDGSVEWRILFG